jgi:uncharacterized protein (TIGR02246 family)
MMTMPSQVPAGRSQDESDVRGIVQKYVAARESMDASAIEALFAPEADQLVSSGEWRKGRAAVVKGTLASSQSTGGKRSISVESIRFVARDVAIVDGRYELTGLAGGKTRQMWTTLLMIREGQNWKITAIRNMLPAPPAPSK